MSYPPPHDERRCTRTTAKGARCRSSRISWPTEIPLPDPQSCLPHLTGPERAARDADKPRREAETILLLDLPWHRLITSDPACWSWPPPTTDDLERIRGAYSERTRELLDASDAWGGILMDKWQAGRCAICGGCCRLVDDHDHQTGLMRGLLCRRCNTLEGMGHDGAFAKYREFNPAAICGVRERYWNPFTKEYAEPPKPYDPWRDNPMKGIGLRAPGPPGACSPPTPQTDRTSEQRRAVRRAGLPPAR